MASQLVPESRKHEKCNSGIMVNNLITVVLIKKSAIKSDRTWKLKTKI